MINAEAPDVEARDGHQLAFYILWPGKRKRIRTCPSPVALKEIRCSKDNRYEAQQVKFMVVAMAGFVSATPECGMDDN